MGPTKAATAKTGNANERCSGAQKSAKLPLQQHLVSAKPLEPPLTADTAYRSGERGCSGHTGEEA